MNVMIGVDGSVNSFAALELAGRLLAPKSDSITLYYAPPHIDIHIRSELDPEVLDRVHGLLTAAVFEAASERLPSDLRAIVHTMRGTQKAAHGLALAASECNADLVMLGARGASTPRYIGVGSVARHVVHTSSVPVLVVRNQAEDRDKLRVLLACDGSECSRNAGELLHRFHWPEGSVGRVTTVVESLVAGRVPEWLETELRDSEAESTGLNFFERTDEEIQRARTDLVRYFGELPSLFQTQKPIISQGNPAQQILNTIESEKIDLVVVGARGLGPIERFFLGSTSEHLLTHAPCNVLVVREHEKP